MDQNKTKYKSTFGSFIFLSRWLQAPLYFGLIVAQSVYVYRFFIELWHLIGFSLLGHKPPAPLAEALKDAQGNVAMDMLVMLSVLGLIDVVMIANLLIMVIVGGYETFVSRLNLAGHPDQPEWLSHVNAGILKVKLGTALIGILSIHLLKTFISVKDHTFDSIYWQVIIHLVFVASAIALAWIDRLTFRPPTANIDLMNVIGIQFDIAWENKAANFAKVHQLITEARPEKDSLIVLPEMFATGFSMNAETVAEIYGGETEQFLARTAQEFGVSILAGAAMRSRDGRTRNKALVFSPEGKLIAYYAKIKPFTVGGEPKHYTAGERVTVFDLNGWRISPFICFDLRFPELFRQAAGQARPELFIVIASWPEKRSTHWLRLLQARAIENQAYVIGVNRIGNDPYYSYNGGSVVINPHGDLVADAGNREGSIRAQLDLNNLGKYREGLPFLDDLKL